jgi:hypothetical protein
MRDMKLPVLKSEVPTTDAIFLGAHCAFDKEIADY